MKVEVGRVGRPGLDVCWQPWTRAALFVRESGGREACALAQPELVKHDAEQSVREGEGEGEKGERDTHKERERERGE